MVLEEKTAPMAPPSPLRLALPLDALCPQSVPQLPCSPQRLTLPLDVLCPQAVPEPLRIDLPVSFVSLGALLLPRETYSDSAVSAVHLDEASLLSPPGLAPSPDAPSLGSVDHGTGVCRPCAWFWKRGGCKSGRLCSHCHLCPEGELKARRKAKVLTLRLGSVTPKSDADAGILGSISPSPPGLTLFDSSHDRFADGTSSESETTVGTSSDGDESRNVSPLVPELSPHPQRADTLFGAETHQPCAWISKPAGCWDGVDARKFDNAVSKSKTSPTGATRFALSLADCL